MESASCPQCRVIRRDPNHSFCTHCGLALKQPCPHCSGELDTPCDPFTTCAACRRDFWSCASCGRLYHLDRTSCQNAYCPEQGSFWTTRFGQDEYFQQFHERVRSLPSPRTEDLRPAWVGGATAGPDIRWPNLHTLGLLLSVQDSGVVELWAERGAPVPSSDSDFRERSVCLTRLDLGEVSPCPPLRWNGLVLIPGSHTLSVLEMTSSPSVGKRIDLTSVGKPSHFATLGHTLLLWGAGGLGTISSDLTCQFQSELSVGQDCLIVSDGVGSAMLVSGNPPVGRLWLDGQLSDSALAVGLTEPVDYALYADRFILISGHKLAHFQEGRFVITELPAVVVAQPLYSAEDNRLTLMLNDGSIRSCSTGGDRLSFVCELAGAPTTDPIMLGGRVFYGTEGRYLCCDEEAIRPRLSAPPMGALSYANGRIFGNLRDGSMFCFEL